MAFLHNNPSARRRWLITLTAAAVLLFVGIILQTAFKVNITGFLKDLFYLKYLPSLGSNASFGLLLLFGLLTSFHCIGMCGGIILTQSLRKDSAGSDQPDGQGNTSATEKRHGLYRSTAFYNLGRVVSYTIVGGIVGGLGQVLSLSGVMKGIIPILGGLFMLVMAVNLLGIFPILRHLNIGMPKFLAKRLRNIGANSSLVVGLLTGLMPCGPLQIMELYALGTRSVFYGAASLFVFAVGTFPGLFLFGVLSSALSKNFSKIILRVSAILVAVLGIIMIGRGLALEGISLPSFSAPVSNTADGYAVSVIKGNVQTVTTSAGQDYFPPIQVTQGIRVIWTIKMSKDAYCDCNNAITVPEYHIEKKLSVGDNVVEFTPNKAGEFVYTCWMGMIKSKIRVVAGAGIQQTEASKSAAVSSSETSSCGSSKQAASSMTCSSSTESCGSSSCASCMSEKPKSSVAVSSAPAKKPEQNDAQTFTGYIIDEDCITNYPNPADETHTCLSMESCASSGYGIEIPQVDGSYRFYFFDGVIAFNRSANGGQKAAADFIKYHIPDGNVKVTITGRRTGTKRISPTDSSCGSYEVITVFSIK